MQLVLTEPGTSLGKTSERLVVRKNHEPVAEIPLHTLDFVFVASHGVSLSSDIVQACLQRSIGLAFLDRKGQVFAEIISPTDFGKAELRRLQFEARTNGIGVDLAKAFLEGKLKNQAANLRYFAKSRRISDPAIHAALLAHADAIDAILRKVWDIAAVDTDTIRPRLLNLEGHAAIRYWQGVRLILPADLGFEGRHNRHATDLFNVALNYGYGILYAKILAVLLQAGLDPYAGFIHAPAENRPTLVFDFIEEFRQLVVDRPLIASVTKGHPLAFEEDPEEGPVLSRDTRHHITRLVLQRLEETEPYEGRETKLSDILLQEAYEVARAIRGTERHRPHIGRW